MPLILGTNSIKDTGYDVANSCRFNGASDDGLNRTLGTPTNNYKWTISFWLKRTELGVEDAIMTSFTNTQNRGMLLFRTDDTLEILDLQSDSYVMQKKTNRVFRDVSAWYHIVISSDATLSSPETKFYVNGVEETSFATTNEYTQNQTNKWNSAIANYIGNDSSTRDFSGYLAEFVFIDGQALAADQFGEFDSDSPTIWKPIDVSGLTFGNNGFYLDFEDSSNLGNDANGGTDWTVSNLTAIDQSTDTCTNNFATWNPLNRNTSMGSFHHGNLEYEVDATFFRTAFATFGASQGKWYFECKRVIGTSFSIGIISLDYKNRTSNVSYIGGAGDATNNIGYLKDGNTAIGGSETSGYASYGNGDTVMVAMDIDNGKVYFGVNGTWGNSGDPTSGSSGTGAVSFTPSGETWTFAVSVYDSHWEANFGSPMYSISSGNSDANGYGNFEYAVPSGYYALNTKNLSEFG
jgi:hypothetical protein